MTTRGRRLVAAGACLLVAATAWLLLWPVPLQPVRWQAPADAGHVDPYAGDERLRHAALIGLGDHVGPEDLAFGPDGLLYASVADGAILRMTAGGERPSLFARTGGRPLGIEFDADGRLLVANAYLGLQRIGADGEVELLLQSVDGSDIVYADDVAVAADGRIFLTDATTRFSPGAHGGTLEASIVDLLEHGDSGRVIEFDPATGRARVFAAGLSFANGVAVSADQRFLLVAETGSYRIWRYPLGGGQRELVLDNLPDFPDNLNNGLQGRIWVGLAAPRDPLLDRHAGRPWLRRVFARLPAGLRPAPVAHSHVIAITVDGEVLMNLQDSGARLPALTGAIETPEAIYLSSLTAPALGRLDKRDLARR